MVPRPRPHIAPFYRVIIASLHSTGVCYLRLWPVVVHVIHVSIMYVYDVVTVCVA